MADKGKRSAKPTQEGRTLDIKVVANPLNSRPVLVADGFAVLSGLLTFKGTIHDPQLGPIGFELEMEVKDRKARARAVTIRTDRESGVNSTVIRHIPIRDLMATGLRESLLSVELTKDGAKLTPVGADFGPEALEAIKSAVGYEPEVGP